jgi:hypothetical protein
MTPPKRPFITGRPLPTTSLPKAALASRRAADVKIAPAAKVATPAKVAAPAKIAAPVKVASPPANGHAAASPRPHVARIGKQRSKKRWAILAAIMLLLGVGIAFAMGFLGPHKSMAELREKLKDPTLSEDDRRAVWQQMRQQRGAGDFGARRDFGGRRGGGDDRVKKFFAMSPADQLKELDKDIDEMLKRAAKDGQNGNNPAANGNGGGNGRGGGGGRDPNQANAGRNRMLSSIPADSRANRTINREMRQAYNEMLQGRANQRGVSVPPGRGRGG